MKAACLLMCCGVALGAGMHHGARGRRHDPAQVRVRNCRPPRLRPRHAPTWLYCTGAVLRRDPAPHVPVAVAVRQIGLVYACRHGASLAPRDVDGNTPSHLAAIHGHLVLLTHLLQASQAPRTRDCWGLGPGGQASRPRNWTCCTHDLAVTSSSWLCLLSLAGVAPRWRCTPLESL